MDKEVLFKRKAAGADRVVVVELDDGVEVTVRALTRGEVQRAREALPDEHAYELRLLATAIVDPVMSLEDVELWIDGDPGDPADNGAPAGDSVRVMKRVAELSGLTEQGAQKSLPRARRTRKR